MEGDRNRVRPKAQGDLMRSVTAKTHFQTESSRSVHGQGQQQEAMKPVAP